MAYGKASEFIYKLKYYTIIRIICWPFLNLVMLWRRLTFRFGKDSKYILSLKNKYKDQRCFIIGNGPSLKLEDLENLKNEKTFAANRIYKLFDKTNWRPTFLISCDPDLIKEDIKIFQSVRDCDVFLDIKSKKYIVGGKRNFHLLNTNGMFTVKKLSISPISFSENIEKYIGLGSLVSYISIQFAIYMGFKEIYLIGMDHSYKNTAHLNGNIVINADVKDDHFYKNGKEKYSGSAFLEGADHAYQLARDYADAHGIKIYNATRGGKLEIFERVDFDEIDFKGDV